MSHMETGDREEQRPIGAGGEAKRPRFPFKVLDRYEDQAQQQACEQSPKLSPAPAALGGMFAEPRGAAARQQDDRIRQREFNAGQSARGPNFRAWLNRDVIIAEQQKAKKRGFSQDEKQHPPPSHGFRDWCRGSTYAGFFEV